MLKYTKNILIFLSVLIITMQFSFSASAIKIDGNAGNAEWLDAEGYNVIEVNSNCGCEITFMHIQLLPDENDKVIYFCSKLLLPLDDENVNNISIILSFNGNSDIVLNMDGTCEYDNELYFAECRSSYYTSGGIAIIEAAITVKTGIEYNSSLSIYATDTSAQRSKTYDLDVLSYEEHFDETTEKTASAKSKKTAKIKTTKTKTTKITKSKTTKSTTTIESSVKISAEQGSDKSIRDTSLAANRKNLGYICAAVVAGSAAVVFVVYCMKASKKTKNKDNDEEQ